MTHYTSTMNNGNRNDSNDTNSATPPLFTFSTNLFMLDPTAESTVSQPFQAAFSSVRPAVQHGVKREASSPPMGMERRQGPALAASPTSMSQRSIYSPGDGYLDPVAPAATPTGINLGGYSGGTTPGFDTLEELPDFNRVDTLPDEDRMSIASDAGSSAEPEHRLPPSPRLTTSPTSHPASQTSPILKIEDHTSSRQSHQLPPHPHTPISRNSSSSNPSSPHPQPTPDDNGNWHSHSRCGLSPEARDDTYLLLSPEEQEIQRLKLAKAKEIEQWLRGSMLVLPLVEVAGNYSGEGAGSGRKLKAPRSGGHRRAKSATDFQHHGVQTQMERDQSNVQQGTGAGMSTGDPGLVDDESEDDDDASVPVGWRESSLPSSDTLSDYQAELPSSASGLCTESDNEHERLPPEHDPTLEPPAHQFFSRPPWTDIAPAIHHGATSTMQTHPATAASAIQKFEQYARNIETASRVATFGSHMRRNSTGDAEGVGVVLERFSFGKNKGPASPSGGGSRRPSIWGGFQKSLKRTLSSVETDSSSTSTSTMKPKDNNNLPAPAPPLWKGHGKRGSSFGGSSSTALPFAPSRLGTGFGVPSLKLDTTIKRSSTNTIGGAFAQMTSPLMAPGAGSGSHSALPTSPKPTSPNQQKQSTNTLMGHLTRSRSRSRNRSGSDLQRKHVFGVVTSLIGPALPSGVSPVSPQAKRWGESERERGRQEMLSPVSAERRGFDVDDGGDAAMSDNNNINDEEESILPQQQLPPHQPHHQKTQHEAPIPAPYPTPTIIPTFDGFTAHILSLSPHLHPELVERFANEQCKRFRKLVDHRQKHLKALDEKGMCGNGEGVCRKVRGQVGVGGEGVVGVLAGRRGGGNTGNKEEGEGEEVYDSDHPQHASTSHAPTTTPATFPPLIPSPPTPHLPSTFECPICFKPKSITKPSDWTKHVHEDLQPFTCTFPGCNEPKSFKRKADWVRHENERHRQLEWWVCQEGGCGHRCYRRDNFLQHLVREHKYTETKRKTSTGGGGPAEKEELWRKIDACHYTTTQDPQAEKCRFCGAACQSFKKLTVHLAKHMEGIALPVLGLVTDEARPPVGVPKRRGRVGAQAQVHVQQQQQQIRHQQQATAMTAAARGQVPISPAAGQLHPHSQALQQMPTIPAVSTTIAVPAAMGPTQIPTPTPTSTGLTPITPVSVNTSISNPGVYQPSPTAAVGMDYHHPHQHQHQHQHQHHPNPSPSPSIQQQYQPVDYRQLQQQMMQQRNHDLQQLQQQQQRYDRLPRPPHSGHHRSPSAPDLPTFGMAGGMFQHSPPPPPPQTYLHHQQPQHHPQQNGVGINMNMNLYQFPNPCTNPSQGSHQMQQMEETQMAVVDSGMGVDGMEGMDGVDGMEDVEIPMGMGMGGIGGMGGMVYTGLQAQGTRGW
ncbi:hypothetical protein EX30DRAFT_174089 [Ascodesmis nigricans]|uniref:C2H2-type domain-containing protein n=1 Tax=Ascodesmis nigricans TaxID=341454 RepID=A0A4S2MLW5_9PEZI|nr:hypothetical protein EX30DRAFT_174089 [Ascodesmis nigricans]